MREGRLLREFVRTICTSTSGGVERVTDVQTDKDEEQAWADEPDEALDLLRRRDCRQPTPALVRFHLETHLPLRECCPECVAAAANDHPHHSRPAECREPLTVPEVHWDYRFPRDAEGDQYAVVLVGRDKRDKNDCCVVLTEGADMDCVTEQAARNLLRFGIHGDVILKKRPGTGHCGCLEGENQTMGPRRTIIEASPVGDSKSNSVAERAVQSMEKLIRVHNLAIETRIKEILSVRHPPFCMVGGVSRGLVQQVLGRIRWQDGPTATEGEARETLEPGDGRIRHSRDVQSVRKNSRVFDG